MTGRATPSGAAITHPMFQSYVTVLPVVEAASLVRAVPVLEGDDEVLEVVEFIAG